VESKINDSEYGVEDVCLCNQLTYQDLTFCDFFVLRACKNAAGCGQFRIISLSTISGNFVATWNAVVPPMS
jgi:hypothetical protein